MFKFTSATKTTPATATPRSNQKGSRIRQRMMAAPNHYYPNNLGLSHKESVEWYSDDLADAMEKEGLWVESNYGSYLFGTKDRTAQKTNTVPPNTLGETGRDFGGQYMQVIENPVSIAKALKAEKDGYRYIRYLDGKTYQSMEYGKGLIEWSAEVLLEAEALGATASEIGNFACWKAGKISITAAIDLMPLYAAAMSRGTGFYPCAADSRILEAASRLHSSMEWTLPCSSMVGTNDHNANPDNRDLRELELMTDRRERENYDRPLPVKKTDTLTDEMAENDRLAIERAQRAIDAWEQADTDEWYTAAGAEIASAIMSIADMQMSADIRDRLNSKLKTIGQAALSGAATPAELE